eukprot:1137298-Pelagomonas_calceolata.AAC.1
MRGDSFPKHGSNKVKAILYLPHQAFLHDSQCTCFPPDLLASINGHLLTQQAARCWASSDGLPETLHPHNAGKSLVANQLAVMPTTELDAY